MTMRLLLSFFLVIAGTVSSQQLDDDIPLAGRINHFSSSRVASPNDDDDYDDRRVVMDALGFATGPFPMGWPYEDNESGSTIAYWLGNVAMEVWSFAQDESAQSSWMVFEPATEDLGRNLESILKEMPFEHYCQDVPPISGTGSPYLYKSCFLTSFPNNTQSNVEYSHTWNYPFFPLHSYTYASRAPQGTLGLIGVESIVWSTNHSSLSEQADMWSELMNVGWTFCNETLQTSACFPATAGYGMQGPALIVQGDGVFEGLSHIVATVYDLDVAAAAIRDATSSNVTAQDISTNGVNLADLTFVFKADDDASEYFSAQSCSNSSFSDMWPEQCSFVKGGLPAQSDSSGDRSSPETNAFFFSVLIAAIGILSLSFVDYLV